MASLLHRLAKVLRPRPGPAREELKALFRAHHRSFRALLTANNDALEKMAELEAALHGGEPFGMAFVRGRCTALGVDVFKMVQALRDLSGGRYRDLPERFRAITARLEAVLAGHPQPAGGRPVLVLGLDEIDRRAVDQVGDKLANLGEVRNRLGLRVPEGFAVTAAASRHFLEASRLQDEINRRLKTLDPEDLAAVYETSTAIQKLIGAAALPADLEEAIRGGYRRLAAAVGGEPRVSLRSSALGEDRRQASFAGQYRTHLDVRPDLVAHHYRGVVASKYRAEAIVYRQQRGYRHQDVLMCVGCLAMVDAAVSGVAFSRPPDDPRAPWVVVHAASGPGAGVVEGSARHDLFRVSRDPPHAIAAREVGASPAGEACLTDGQLRELAATCARIEDHFGSPQDVEWALDRAGRLFVLQARPLAVEAALPAPGAPALAGDGAPVPLLAGGVTASRGVGAGPVFRVRSGSDVLRFPRGAVLVVETPYPDWAVVLGRASAVLAATGQIATHLATVARELAVPAVFGLPGVAERLADGRIVTVDATSRRVYEGRVEALLSAPPPRPNLMEGSPIHRLLAQALTLVTPLHLTDPGSRLFRASACRTLHDVTRFCHEKAVAEVFDFGRRHGVGERAARRLVVAGVPSQWWVIDLDDGFRKDLALEGPFVRIEDVVSAPMLAVWKGMTAVPWQGPPPVSLRGFGAIVAQSAMNPELDPAVRSRLAARNYFLVSRTFCNLSVRLGYHYALAEASLSELLAESYVNFQFKGGAADERRRGRRVRLLADTLRDMDFRVELTGDALTARIEKRPAAYLRERLVVLGYLLIHTRQIDMAMDEPDFVERYLARIHADIRAIRAGLAAEAGGS